VNGALLRPIAAIGGILMAPLVSLWPAEAAAVSCAQAAAIAETAAFLPPGLLLAIGNVESGRIDASGQRAPWPWTINAGGIGRFFASAEEAILATERLHAGGVESIDVGCFQINLFHHPDAFPDLAHGFDPLANAEAAAKFLTALHEEFGTWGRRSRRTIRGWIRRARRIVIRCWRRGMVALSPAGSDLAASMCGVRPANLASITVRLRRIPG
jgi:hypothetical protein